MLWILFALLAALSWAAVDLIDKFVIGKEMKDPIYATVISGLAGSSILISLSFISRPMLIPLPMAIISLLAGAVLRAGVIIYYKAVQIEEISRIVPALCSESLFVLIFAMIFFRERYDPVTYLGIFAIVMGASLISMHISSFSINKGVLLATLAAMMFALRTIMIKYGTNSTGVWPLLFWIGLGQAVVSATLLVIHHDHIRELSKKGIMHLILGSAVSQAGFISFIMALSTGPVTLVAALAQLQPFIVFVAATASSIYLPKMLKEEISRKSLIQKLSATALVFIGLLLIL